MVKTINFGRGVMASLPAQSVFLPQASGDLPADLASCKIALG
jgi:hypothetical protein